MSRSNVARGVCVVLLALSGSCGAGGKFEFLCFAGTSNESTFIFDVPISADSLNEAESACPKDPTVKAAAKNQGVTGSYSCSCQPAIIPGQPLAPSRR